MATFTWQPDPSNLTEPPPSSAIVSQTCQASWHVTNNYLAASSSGDASNGLGAVAPASTTGGTAGSTLYTIWSAPDPAHPPTTFSVNCSPAAHFSGDSGSVAHATISGSIEVTYFASASGVFIDLGGTTVVNGTREALTGRQVTASLAPLPQNHSASDYHWGVKSDPATGNQIVGNYVAAQGVGMTLPVSPLTNPTVAFFDGFQNTAVVNLTVTIKFPDNTTGTATPQTQVAVVKPTALTPTFSIAEFDNFSQHPNDAMSTYGATEHFDHILITMPPGFTGGSGIIVQKILSTSRTDTRHTGAPYTAHEKQSGGTWIAIPAPCLDTNFPYPFAAPWAVTSTGSGIDVPSFYCAPSLVSGDTGVDWYTSSGNDQFMDWIMYNPNNNDPAHNISVPLSTFTWGWSASATYNATTGAWSVAGFMPNSGSAFKDALDWPMWDTWAPYSGDLELQMRPN